MEKKFNYSNWVPLKMIVVPVLLAVACAVLLPVSLWFLLGTFIFAGIALYFAAARRVFSPRGGNLQDKVQNLILDRLQPVEGKPLRVLDIGCGNGPLTVGAALRYPQAELVGVDTWGRHWDYSLQVCHANAQQAGVVERITFRQASATELPFEDDSFDVVLSNLVFHEVKEAVDKRTGVREALRVLKPGGTFILQDLFLLQPYYGTPQELVDLVKSWGISQVEFIRTCDQDFIPGLVKLPFMIGTLAMLVGVK
jgi:ubiquinone/menaquinone biosynthesis C-methylase UbiE